MAHVSNLIGFEEFSQTVPQFMLESLLRFRNPKAWGHKVQDAWEHFSYTEIIEKIKKITFGLSEIGIKAGDRVAIISENRPEWCFADLAILSLRGVNVPIYTTQAVDQIRYILEDSGAKALFISGKKLWKHAAAALEGVEQLEKLIFFDDEALPENDSRAMTFAQLEAQGEELNKIDERAYARLLAEIKTDDLATVIYTSGTTGEPKGVMLTHGNFTSNVLEISKGLPILPTDRSLSVLPLSHIFERVCFYVMAANGVSVHYCASFDQLAPGLQEVKPTVMTAVPRLFEQVYHKIVKKGMSAGGWKTKLFTWALGVGQKYWDYKEKRKAVPATLAAKHAIADRLVFSKWRSGVGGELRFFVSGGAPLSKKLSYAFWAAGIPILQGYGMTEACVVSANRPEDTHIDSIGTVFDGIEMKVAADGELLVRGPNVMLGYYNKPEITAEVLKDGWYHTGDIGYQGDDGHFYITDRKKDLFKLSNGKYIAPQQVESLLKQSPLIAQPVVVGANRKQVGALIVPDWETLKAVLEENRIDINASREELCERPEVIKFMQNEAVNLTRELADYERVKRVYLLPREFSIDKGEMTPTLKIKRGVIDEKYSEAIDEICGS
jgi:long-chain acyl-CoA synthetase